MGHYSLILEKRYQEFCDVYREKRGICAKRTRESMETYSRAVRYGRCWLLESMRRPLRSAGR